MLIIGIPFFALALGVTYVGKTRRAAEHLVFSSHVWAFFVFMTFATPLFGPATGCARWVRRMLSFTS